jgi:hypothetical protein
MRRIMPGLAVAVVALAVACTDATSPGATTRTPGAPRALVGNPPPPPADTGSYASTQQGAFFMYSTYFMNPAGTNGWIHFPNGQQSNGVIISPDAAIQFHQGQVSGKGTITAPVGGGIILIDLSTVNTGKFYGSCDGGCAEIPFTGTFTDKQGNSSPTDGALFVGGGIPIVTRG